VAKTKSKAQGKKANKGLSLLGSIFKWAFRSVMAMLTVCLCLILIASAYSDLIRPTFWVIPSFLGIAFGAILLVGIIWFVVLLITRRWHSLLLLCATFAIVAVPAWRYCPLHFKGGPEPLTLTDNGEEIKVDSVRVFSFNTNIMGQSHLSRVKEHIPVIDVVRKSKADIVCMQEYSFSLGKNGHTEQELREELADLYPYYDFTPLDRSKRLGIATYSKYPIRKATRVDKRKTGYFSAMYYQIDVKGHTLGLVNMHLHITMIDPKDRLLYEEMIERFEVDSLQRIRSGMMRSLAQSYRLRSAEVTMLRQFLLNHHPEGMPLLLCGDMNDTPVSYCHRALRQMGLTDTWQECGFGPGITFRAHHFWFRIDHMLHDKHLRPLCMKVRRDVTLSDHYPIEATFQILPQ
jgi:endonuclease/exonuclease/phosphatase family metal-dependent hydrolase